MSGAFCLSKILQQKTAEWRFSCTLPGNLGFFVWGALAALFAEFLELDFAFHFLLVFGSKIVRALALRTLETDEVIL